MHHPPSPPSDSPLSPALMRVAPFSPTWLAPSLMPGSTSSPNQAWGPGAANRTQRCLKWIFARPSRCGRRRAATLVVVATVCVLFVFTTIDDRAVAVGVSGKRPDQRGESPDPRSDQMTCEQGKPDLQLEYWVWVMVPMVLWVNRMGAFPERCGSSSPHQRTGPHKRTRPHRQTEPRGIPLSRW